MLDNLDTESQTYDSPDGESTSLLSNWVCEQSQRFAKLQRQLLFITDLPAENLDDLADRLEDIDFHTAALSNILDLVVGSGMEDVTPEYTETCETKISDSDESYSLMRRWPLLQALWFHVMMKTDPESIYYSKIIGGDVWPDDNPDGRPV